MSHNRTPFLCNSGEVNLLKLNCKNFKTRLRSLNFTVEMSIGLAVDINKFKFSSRLESSVENSMWLWWAFVSRKLISWLISCSWVCEAERICWFCFSEEEKMSGAESLELALLEFSIPTEQLNALSESLRMMFSWLFGNLIVNSRWKFIEFQRDSEWNCKRCR